jgi:hypothetical protein
MLTSESTGRVPSPAEVADRLAIADVLARHSRGVDRADETQLKAAYWPDAEVEYGGFNGNAHTFCAMLPRAIRAFTYTHHAIGNVVIDIVGHDARVETYVTARHYTASDDSYMTFIGRYLDRMQRRERVWKILHRRVVMDWNQHGPARAKWDGAPFDGLARGSRYPDDPLYEPPR